MGRKERMERKEREEKRTGKIGLVAREIKAGGIRDVL